MTLYILLAVFVWFAVGSIILAINTNLAKKVLNADDSLALALIKITLFTGFLGLLLAFVGFIVQNHQINKFKKSIDMNKPHDNKNPFIGMESDGSSEKETEKFLEILKMMKSVKERLGSAIQLTGENIGDKVYPVDNSYAFFTDTGKDIGYLLRPAGTINEDPMECIVCSAPYIKEIQTIMGESIKVEMVDLHILKTNQNVTMLNYFRFVEETTDN